MCGEKSLIATHTRNDRGASAKFLFFSFQRVTIKQRITCASLVEHIISFDNRLVHITQSVPQLLLAFLHQCKEVNCFRDDTNKISDLLGIPN
jgi:hypothetical protein